MYSITFLAIFSAMSLESNPRTPAFYLELITNPNNESISIFRRMYLRIVQETHNDRNKYSYNGKHLLLRSFLAWSFQAVSEESECRKLRESNLSLDDQKLPRPAFRAVCMVCSGTCTSISLLGERSSPKVGRSRSDLNAARSPVPFACH